MKHSILPRFSKTAFCGVILTAGMIETSLQAADATWSGATGSQLWSLGSNWTPTTAPGATTGTTNGDTATFNAVAATTQITVDPNRIIRNLTFGTGLVNYTIGDATANTGEILHLSSTGAITVNSGATSTVTINAPLILEAASTSTAGTYTFSNNATAASTTATTPKLNIAGNISGGTTSSNVTLTLAGTVGTRNATDSALAIEQANTLRGIISDGGVTGAAGFSINVNGTTTGTSSIYNAWNLTGVNTYTGDTTVTAGALYFNTIANTGIASALGTGTKGTIKIGGAGFLVYTGVAASTDRTFTGNGGYFLNNGGALTLNGAITTVSGFTFRGSSTFIVNSLISGAGGVGNNPSSGGVTILNNNNNSFTGSLTVNDGTVRFATIANAGTNSAIGTSSTVTNSGTSGTILLGQDSSTVGTLDYTGAAASTDRNITLTNGATGGGTVGNSGNGRILSNGTGTLTLDGWIRPSNSNTDYVSSLELGGSRNGIVNGLIGGSSAATATATSVKKTGTGIWELKATTGNNYKGTTTVSGGTLLANNTSGSATGTGSVSVTTGATIGGTGSITGGAASSISLASGTFLMVGNTHNVAAATTGANGYVSAVADFDLGSANNVAITLAGTLQFDLFANTTGTPASEADLLKISTTAASINVNGATISVADVSGAAAGSWTEGTWKLIDWAGITKSGTPILTFSLPTTALASGYTWSTASFLNDGTISIVAIPEPSRALLLGLGLGWLILRRRVK